MGIPVRRYSIGMQNVVVSGDLIKLLWFDGDGLCLFQKRLERGRFIWPQATSGTVSLSRAQLSMLLEGIDWRRPDRTWQPPMAV
jgi:transposase